MTVRAPYHPLPPTRGVNFPGYGNWLDFGQSPPVPTGHVPLTVECLHRPTTPTNYQEPFGYGEAGGWYIDRADTGDWILYLNNTSAGTVQIPSITNTWQYLAFTFLPTSGSSASVVAYTADAPEWRFRQVDSDTFGATLTGPGSYGITVNNSSWNAPSTGDLLFCRIWSRALTAGELRQIAARRLSPSARPPGLVFHWDAANPRRDLITGRIGTQTGTFSQSTGPVVVPASQGLILPWEPERRIWAPPAGGGGTTFPVSLGGTLSISGAVTKRDNKTFTGTLATAGALTKQTRRSLAGTLASSGALRKIVQKLPTGTLASAGTLTTTKVKVVALAGTLATAGALRRQINKALAGTLTGAGALTKSVSRALSGTLTTSGSLSATGPGGPVWSDEFTVLDLADDTASGTWRTKGYETPGTVDEGYLDYAGSSWNVSPAEHPAQNPFSVASSVLTIKAQRTPPEVTDVDGAEWMGGYLVTNHLNTTPLRWRFGYFEVRARCPNPVRGMFPALWLFNNLSPRSDGFEGAEIDIMEIFGHRDGQPWSGGWHNKPTPGTAGNAGDFDDDTTNWHRYGVEWTSTSIRWFKDGIQKAELTGTNAEWFQDADLGIRLDYVMDPSWESPGSEFRSTATDPVPGTEPRIEIDYVRVYSELPSPLPTGSDDPEGASGGQPDPNGDAYSVDTLARSPWAYYRLNEAAGEVMFDSSGNDRHGAYDGEIAYNEQAVLDGTTDPAIDFGADGSGALSGGSAGVAGTTTWTVEGWFIALNNPADHAGYFGSRSFANGDCYVLHLSGSNELEARFINSSGTEHTLVVDITPNVRHYVAIVYDGSTFKCYVDGALGNLASGGSNNASMAASGQITNSGLEFSVGRVLDKYTGTRVDEVAIFRTALSAADIEDRWLIGTTSLATPTGGLSLSGAMRAITNKALSGTLASSGALTKQTSHTLSGTLTTAGTLLKRVSRLLAGTLTASGSVASEISSGSTTLQVTVSGTLTLAGTLARRVAQTLTGTLGAAGSLIQQVRRRLTGTLTQAGALTPVKQKNVSRSGALTPGGGSVTSHLIHGVSVTATLSQTGDLDLVIIRQPQIPPPEYTPLPDLSPPQGTLVSDTSPTQGTLLSDDTPPEFIPRS